MPVSGLVITLVADAVRAEEGMARLLEHPALEIGVCGGRQVAAVAECDDHGHDLLESIRILPGIAHVDVVFVEVETPEVEGSMPAEHPR